MRTTSCRPSATAYSFADASLYLEAVSSIGNPRMHHAVVTGTNITMYFIVIFLIYLKLYM